jgi:uncharacterized repeat protein (TIGR03803 family)
LPSKSLPCRDGAYPAGDLTIDGSGNLYGTTYSGGGTDCGDFKYGCGTVFKLTPSLGETYTETVLHEFSNGPGSSWL